MMRNLSPIPILLAIIDIYICFAIRAVRWSVLLSPIRKTPIKSLLSAQYIGFTVVALFGRVADLARPWLIARKLHSPVPTQIAIYSIERAFDLAAAAILFSLALAFSPANMPHHELFARTGAVSLAATLGLALFTLALRFYSTPLVKLIHRLLPPKPAEAISTRLLHFSEGLKAISTVSEFLSTLALSLLMWAGVAVSYWLCAHAFPATPQLAHFTLSATMLIMATSMGGSLLQLPILGWFTQIALLAATLHTLFGVPLQAASACSTAWLIVTMLCVIPAGLLLAHREGITLRDAARHSKPA